MLIDSDWKCYNGSPATTIINIKYINWIVRLWHRGNFEKQTIELTSDQFSTRQTALQRSFSHSCRDIGLSLSSHVSLELPLTDWQVTSLLWAALWRLRHFDDKHGVQSPATQREHSTPPHFSTTSGNERPASSHSALSTLCVALSSRTMQWALRNWKKCRKTKKKKEKSFFLLRKYGKTFCSKNISFIINQIYLKSHFCATALRTFGPGCNHPFEFHILSVTDA